MADKSEAIEKAVVTLHQLSEDKKIKLQCEATLLDGLAELYENQLSKGTGG